MNFMITTTLIAVTLVSISATAALLMMAGELSRLRAEHTQSMDRIILILEKAHKYGDELNF